MKPRRLIVAVLAVVAVLFVGGAVVASLINAESIKRELAATVQEKYRRTLKIDGPLELAFWPEVGVKLGKLSLSEHDSAQVFAAVDSARIAVAVRPLLSRQIVVDAIDIGGAKAALIRRKDGSFNIDDLLPKEPSTSPPLRLDIAGIRVADAELSWRDERAAGNAVVAKVALTTGRIQADTGKKVFQAETLALAGALHDIELKIALSGVEGTAQALRVADLVLDVAARAGTSTLKGTLNSALAADLEHRTAALEKLSGEFVLASPRLPMKQIKLPIHGSLRADFARQTADGDLAAQADESALALKFDVAKFAPPTLRFDLDIDRLDVDKYLPPPQAGEKKAAAGKPDFAVLKDIRMSGTVTIGSLRFAGITASKVRLRVDAANGKIDVASQTTRP